MFEFSDLTNGVLLLAEIVLYGVPEVGPIFLHIELWEKRHFTRH